MFVNICNNRPIKANSCMPPSERVEQSQIGRLLRDFSKSEHPTNINKYESSRVEEFAELECRLLDVSDSI